MLRGKPFDYHHAPAIWTWTEERYQKALESGLTAEDGMLLGHCCHKPETAKDASERAHGKRIQAKAAKATKTSKPMPYGRGSDRKLKVNGDIVDRTTGEIIRRSRR